MGTPHGAHGGHFGAQMGLSRGPFWASMGGGEAGVGGCSEKPLALMDAGAAARPTAPPRPISRGGSSGGGPRREGGLAGAVGMAAEAR